MATYLGQAIPVAEDNTEEAAMAEFTTLFATTGCAPEMARHVMELMEQLDSTSANNRMEMLEADLGEPVTSYYEYALIRERMKASGSVGRGSRWAAPGRVGTRSDNVGEELQGIEDDDGCVRREAVGPAFTRSRSRVSRLALQ